MTIEKKSGLDISKTKSSVSSMSDKKSSNKIIKILLVVFGILASVILIFTLIVGYFFYRFVSERQEVEDVVLHNDKVYEEYVQTSIDLVEDFSDDSNQPSPQTPEQAKQRVSQIQEMKNDVRQTKGEFDPENLGIREGPNELTADYAQKIKESADNSRQYLDKISLILESTECLYSQTEKVLILNQQVEEINRRPNETREQVLANLQETKTKSGEYTVIYSEIEDLCFPGEKSEFLDEKTKSEMNKNANAFREMEVNFETLIQAINESDLTKAEEAQEKITSLDQEFSNDQDVTNSFAKSILDYLEPEANAIMDRHIEVEKSREVIEEKYLI